MQYHKGRVYTIQQGRTNGRVCIEPVLSMYLLNENWKEKPSSLTSLQEIPLSTAQLYCTKDRVLQYPACQASEPEGFYKGDNPSVNQSFPIYVYLEENVFSNKADTSVIENTSVSKH